MTKKLILGAFLLLVGLAFLDKAFSAFNPFPSPNPPASSITAKGNILSHNGSVQTQFLACPDGKILEYDSTEDKGLLCGDKTVDTNAATICDDDEYLNGDGTCDAIPSVVAPNYGLSSSSGTFSTSSGSYVDVTNLSVTITTTGSPVIIKLVSGGNNPTFGGSGTSYTKLVRGATSLATHIFAVTGYFNSLDFVDTPSAGTHTYKVQAYASGGSTSVERVKLFVQEIK